MLLTHILNASVTYADRYQLNYREHAENLLQRLGAKGIHDKVLYKFTTEHILRTLVFQAFGFYGPRRPSQKRENFDRYNLSDRAYGALEANGVTSMEELAFVDRELGLTFLEGVGKKTAEEFSEALKIYRASVENSKRRRKKD